jgi:hypothetical protein
MCDRRITQMMNADTYKDASTERMIDSRLTGIVAELTRMVARAERAAQLGSLPGVEDDIERDLRG